MTRQVIPKMETFERPIAQPTEVRQLDEGVWNAWIEKNEHRDKIKGARRVKVIAILILILGAIALVRVVA